MYTAAQQAMDEASFLDVPVFRAWAAAAIEDLNDERLGVVAEKVGAPPIVNRQDFREYIATLDLRSSFSVVVGVMILSEFTPPDLRKMLKDYYGLSAAKVRKEQR